MTHEKLLETVAKFVHGVNSTGRVLMPWTHEKGCGMCDGILEIVEKVLEDYNQAEGVVYPKNEVNHSGSIFDCPACKIK